MDEYYQKALIVLSANACDNLGQIILPPQIYQYIQKYIQKHSEVLKINPVEGELQLTIEGYAQYLREHNGPDK